MHFVRKLAAAMVALVLVMFFVGLGTTIMLAAERRLFHPVAWIRLTGWAITFAFELLPNLAMSLVPSFHPSTLVDPDWYRLWLREYDPATKTGPLWNTANSTH